jgi:UPF0271 protein
MKSIDINCDLGEGAGHDAALMPLITSANIACGQHAGNAATMAATVALAKRHGVAIGAHPGFADRENFGRREICITPRAAAALVLEQIGALQAVAVNAGLCLSHVKLHGALYNMAARDRELAGAVTDAVKAAGERLRFFVLAGSELERVARAQSDLRVVPEIFADRTYQRDGSLTPRSRPDALIADETAMVAQLVRMIKTGCVRATDGTEVPIAAETVCLHGDGAHAVALAQRLRRELTAEGIRIQAPMA